MSGESSGRDKRRDAPGYRHRDTGALNNVGNNGYSWSSAVSGTNGMNLNFNATWLNPSNANNRGYGLQLRCLSAFTRTLRPFCMGCGLIGVAPALSECPRHRLLGGRVRVTARGLQYWGSSSQLPAAGTRGLPGPRAVPSCLRRLTPRANAEIGKSFKSDLRF